MTLIALIELKGNVTVRPMAQLVSRLINWMGGNFRWQFLPTPFTVYADGIDVVFLKSLVPERWHSIYVIMLNVIPC